MSGQPLYRCAQCCDAGCEFCPRVDAGNSAALNRVEPWPRELFADYADVEIERLVVDGIDELHRRAKQVRALERLWGL